MADTIPPILIKLAADVNDLKVGLTQAQNSLRGLDDNIKKSSNGMTNFVGKIKTVGAALGVAFAGSQVLNFLKASVADANAAGLAQDRLATLLRNTNGASEEQIKALIGQADAIEQVGVTTKEQVLVAQSQLATFDLTGATISKLTPAIVDYVQAEKMGAATSDDFRQMTNGLAQALNGNFGSLTRTGFVLDEVTKKTISSGTESERAAAIVKVLDSTYRGFNKSLRDRDPMRAAMLDLQKLRGDIGEKLIPVVQNLGRFISNVFIPALKQFASFIGKNADAIKAFSIVLGGAYLAMKTYRGIIILTTNVKKLYAVATVLMKGAQLASIASTNTLAASMLRLNFIMRANPVGLIVTAVALLIAGFVKLGNRFEIFKKIIDGGIKIIVTGFGYFLGLLAKIVTVLSKLPGGGIFKGMAEGLDQAAISAGRYANAVGQVKAGGGFTYQGPMTQGGKPIGGERPPSTSTTSTKSLTDAAKEKAAAEKKRLTEIKSLQKKFESEQKQLANFEEKKAKLIADYQKDVVKRNAKYDEDVIKAKDATAKRILEIEKDYNKQILNAQKDAAEKRRDIIEQSINRLKDVFKSTSAIDVGKMFAALLSGEDPTQATATTLVDKFKQQLTDIKLLATNASALFDKGFSQVFVEQVVAQGTEVGNKLAAEILAATPETITELQSLFTQIQDTSETGVDVLGQTMYEKLGLATEELKENYAKVGVELREALANYAADFAEAMAETQADLVEKLAELKKDLQSDLAEMQDAFHVALAEINKDIAETIALLLASKNTGESLQLSLTEVMQELLTLAKISNDERKECLQKRWLQLDKNTCFLYNKFLMIITLHNII
jgi:hypothetical protein